MLNKFFRVGFITFIGLAYIVQFEMSSSARQVYSNKDKNWDLCIRYNDNYDLEKNELIIRSETFKELQVSYTVLFACYSKFPKKIEVAAFGYKGKSPYHWINFEFRSFGAAKYYDFGEKKVEQKIPNELFETDFKSVFYDESVTESELEQFTKAMLKLL